MKIGTFEIVIALMLVAANVLAAVVASPVTYKAVAICLMLYVAGIAVVWAAAKALALLDAKAWGHGDEAEFDGLRKHGG
jgi:hypothetical protein